MKVMDQFPECKPLIPRLRRSGVAVEQELARVQAEASGYPERHRQLAAIRYYLRLALWHCQDGWREVHHGITNYSTFLDEIERWRFESEERVCFVTFNYDTMLEEAMATVLRLRVQDMDSYLTWDNYSLFKLHGSINWGRVVEGIVRQGSGPIPSYQNIMETVISNTSTVTGRYHLCGIDMRPSPDIGLSLYPALSIPVEKKDEFSCPPKHVTTLEELLPAVTKMITVGWRASEQDFLKMLEASKSVVISGNRQPLELLVVTGSKEGAEQTVNNLARYDVHQDIFSGPDRMRVTDGFTGLINNMQTLEAFLHTGLY
jgi:hypothetical protein